MENDIKKIEGDNLGGIYSFKFIPVTDVQSIPSTLNGAIHNEVNIKTNTRWYEGYCTIETMNFSDNQEDSDHGAFHTKEFLGIVPKDRPELIDLFNGMKNKRFILDLVDNNGTRKLVGTVEEPLNFSSGFDTKANIAGRNEYKISFKGQGVAKSPIYNV